MTFRPALFRTRLSHGASHRALLCALCAALLVGACMPRDETPSEDAAVVATYTLADGSTLTSADVETFSELHEKAGDLYSDADWPGCAEAYGKAAEVYARNDTVQYNRACCLALAGKIDEGLDALETAIEAGFHDRAHMERDTDLDSFRGLDRFAALLDRADALTEAAEASSESESETGTETEAVAAADPVDGPTVEVPAFEDLDDLENHFDDARRPLRRMLDADDREAVLGQLRRTEMASLAAWGAEHPDDAVPAALRALEVHGSFRDPSSPSFAGAVDAFIAAHEGTTEAAQAELLRQRLAFEPKVLGDSEHEDHAEALATMAATAGAILERDPDGAQPDARLWILRDAMLREDYDAAVAQYETLKASLAEDDSFWKENGYELFGPKIFSEGLPDFEVETLDGEMVSPAALEGQVALLDFWAIWCGPCLAEMPNLQELYREHHDAGFEIFGISADAESQKDLDEFRAWLEQEDVPWPQYYDGLGWKNELNELFGIVGIPTTILLDREGNVAAINLRGEALEAKVSELL